MEPVFMVLGQSAATAATLAIDADCDLQDVDYDRLREQALRERPKMIVGGASAYPRFWDYEVLRSVADEIEANARHGDEPRFRLAVKAFGRQGPVKDAVDRLSGAWADGERPTPEAAKSWRPEEWLLYLEALPEGVEMVMPGDNIKMQVEYASAQKKSVN
mgnify:CR=1 FL=1